MLNLHPYLVEPGVVARPTFAPPASQVTASGVLCVDVIDRAHRAWLSVVARHLGVSTRRWRASGLGSSAGWIVAPGGEPAFDRARWSQVASIAAGAVALPSRTAERLGVARAGIQPPRRAPLRLIDLMRARSVQRRLSRALASVDADLARLEHALVTNVVGPAVADGDAGVAFGQLPRYALAARLDGLLRPAIDWSALAIVDLATPPDDARRSRAASIVDPWWAAIWTIVDELASRLAADGDLGSLDDAYALSLEQLLALARGARI